jgi:acetyl-CoA carboxylase carboxyl transferase subunit alpha
LSRLTNLSREQLRAARAEKFLNMGRRIDEKR